MRHAFRHQQGQQGIRRGLTWSIAVLICFVGSAALTHERNVGYMFLITSPYFALLVCLLGLVAIRWLKRRRERQRRSISMSADLIAAAQEKFNAVRVSEAVQPGFSDIRLGITHEATENQAAPLVPTESTDGITHYARLLAVFAWLWLLVALPFVTDAACSIFAVLGLAIHWLILAFAWLCGLLAAPQLLRSTSPRKWWLSAGLAGILGLLLAFTDVGFVLRVVLSQQALRSYVATVPPGTCQATHCNRLVGLFLVDGTEESNGAVVLYTSTDFLDRHGIAYIPVGAPPPSHVRVKHLFGPWYRFRWHF